jgi:adenylosuccinate lyase
MQSADILIADVDALLAAIRRRAFEHKMTPSIGRSHGIHAEPVTFGLKMAQAFAEFTRCRARLVAAREEIATCAISGAVGTFANIDPRVEEHVAGKMGLMPEPVSTQVIPRDRHAMYFAALAVVASSIERLATEIRHLQRTEVREAEEPFATGAQKGSSAMPHKRNPIRSERLTGLARLLRGYAQTGLENVALWHERDISHSGAERVILPDATITLDYMQSLATSLASGLVVHEDRLRSNLEATHGALFSQRALTALVESGMSRDEAYRVVQSAAQEAFDTGTHFRELIGAGAPDLDLDAVFDYDAYLAHIPEVFERLEALRT